ncbi:hypothetical protein [Georgenia sp.]
MPSGNTPHYDTNVGDVYGCTFGSARITAPSAEDLIDRFIVASSTLVENHHHQTDAG